MQAGKIFLNDKFILSLILLNSIVIFVQEFNGIPHFVYYLDNIFTLLFFIELITKLNYYGVRNYWKSNWNKLDFVLITIACISLLLDILNFQHAVSLEFLTTLRVLRLFKSFRLIKFVPNINSIIAGVNNAIKASYIVVLAFFILLFIISVLTCSLFKEVAPEYFETPLLSLYSIFRIFSIEGWYEIPDLIAERTSAFVSFLSKLYFVLILFGGGILGMSLINSIFVDAMVSDNNDDLEREIRSLSEKIESLTEEIKNIKSNI
ncbi:MAG: ion transporter [Tannerellaceae bacterium]|nr:ion transporter [Tannerellaceae bacterium]